MEEESTKPYVYYERILNGISEIPESIKQKLDHLILIKNENNRIEEAEKKEAEEREAEEREAKEKEAEEQRVEEEREAEKKEAETQPTNLSEKFGQLYKTVSDFIPKTLTQEPLQVPAPLPEPVQAPLPPVQAPLPPVQAPLPPVQVEAPVPLPEPIAPVQVPVKMRNCKIREW
jgi:hypothetical protein